MPLCSSRNACPWYPLRFLGGVSVLWPSLEDACAWHLDLLCRVVWLKFDSSLMKIKHRLNITLSLFQKKKW